MKDKSYHFRCCLATRYPSDYLMRIKLIHFDIKLRLYIGDDVNASQQYI